MSPALSVFLESVAPYLVAWSLAFTVITSLRIGGRIRRGIRKVPDSAVFTELAGLPLTLLQTVCFVMAAFQGDGLSMLLFLWWGPGFVTVLLVLVAARIRGRRIDWHPFRYYISYLCKLYYLAYMLVFYTHQMPGMMFAFSVWIINDQYEKAFMSLDADRTRRTFHDFWLPRLCYPAGLLIPFFFATTPWRTFSMIYGSVLLVLWLAGLWYIARKGEFFALPDDPSLLRNMVYFPRLRVQAATTPRSEKCEEVSTEKHEVETTP